MISLNQTAKNMFTTAKNMFTTAKKREQNGAFVKTDTPTLLKHCATEVVEAMEAYTRWEWDDDNSHTHTLELFESELADIVACVLIIAHLESIDMEEALTKCITKNKKRADGEGDKK